MDYKRILELATGLKVQEVNGRWAAYGATVDVKLVGEGDSPEAAKYDWCCRLLVYHSDVCNVVLNAIEEVYARQEKR